MTDSNLQGRVALVTGASRGIGRGIARRLARSGAQVFVTAHSLHFVRHQGLLCEPLDGGERLATPEIPDYAHPELMDGGE